MPHTPALDPALLPLLGVPTESPPNVGALTPGQAAYLALCNSVFLHGR